MSQLRHLERGHDVVAALSLPNVSTATVSAIDGDTVALRSPRLGQVSARIAVPAWEPRCGDSVLAIDDGRGQVFVIGVLGASRAAPVRFERGEGAARLVVDRGDLELCAPEGKVVLRAADEVRVESERDVTLDARGRATMQSSDAGGRALSAVRLDGEAAEIEAGLFAANARRVAVIAEELTALAARLDARMEDARARATRIEVEARDIVERAETSVRRVSGLAQIEAGRLRLVAEGALSAWAERVKLKAKGVLAVDGESIHLG